MSQIYTFLLALSVEILRTLYILRTSRGQALAAATYGSLTTALGLLATYLCLTDPTSLPPYLVGDFLGTYLCLRYLTPPTGTSSTPGTTSAGSSTSRSTP